MDFVAVQSQINDLPTTFKRPGAPFTQYQDALAAGLTRDTTSVDGVIASASNINNARFGWLDIWGLLFGLPRNQNEPDGRYLARIMYTVLAGAGPPVAIATWIAMVYNVQVTVTDSPTAVGYVITFPTGLTNAQIAVIVASLVRIRPDGVPLTVAQSDAGTFLDTINFLDSPRTTGGYLGGAVADGNLNLSAVTYNAMPLLPDLMLNDPTLNPGIP